MTREPSISPRLDLDGVYDAIENRQKSVRVAMRPLQLFLAKIIRELGLGSDCVAIRLTTDAEMARLNIQYRNKRGTTDVLSFPAEERRRALPSGRRAKKRKGSFLGDIAISPAVARRNARFFGRGFQEELRILMLHGVLHLLGYDHETDHGEMNRIEMRLRRRLGIA